MKSVLVIIYWDVKLSLWHKINSDPWFGIPQQRRVSMNLSASTSDNKGEDQIQSAFEYVLWDQISSEIDGENLGLNQQQEYVDFVALSCFANNWNR